MISCSHDAGSMIWKKANGEHRNPEYELVVERSKAQLQWVTELAAD